MKAIRWIVIVLGLSLGPFLVAKDHFDDKEIANILIKQSIRNYMGNCPCPFNRDKAGRRCGKRSAWSRPGGRSPLCFESDVTKKMIEEYRKKLKEDERHRKK